MRKQRCREERDMLKEESQGPDTEHRAPLTFVRWTGISGLDRGS